VPRLFTRIECGVFGVGWADQLTAVKSSTADPASTFGKSTFSPTRLLLSALCAFARANLRTHFPAKHVLSNVEGTLIDVFCHFDQREKSFFACVVIRVVDVLALRIYIQNKISHIRSK
jgi:hypothetical protein